MGRWSREIHVPQTIEGAFAQGAAEMIVVLPDSKTVHNGSMYSSSVTTGDYGFEVYPGNHTNKVADRFQNHVMRFFSQNLCSQDGCR
jgi:hypothetical protein